MLDRIEQVCGTGRGRADTVLRIASYTVAFVATLQVCSGHAASGPLRSRTSRSMFFPARIMGRYRVPIARLRPQILPWCTGGAIQNEASKKPTAVFGGHAQVGSFAGSPFLGPYPLSGTRYYSLYSECIFNKLYLIVKYIFNLIWKIQPLGRGGNRCTHPAVSASLDICRVMSSMFRSVWERSGTLTLPGVSNWIGNGFECARSGNSDCNAVSR